MVRTTHAQLTSTFLIASLAFANSHGLLLEERQYTCPAGQAYFDGCNGCVS